MRRLCALIAVVALALGFHALPASATHVQQPPLQYRDLGYGTCHVRVMYGDFGDDAFAILGEYSGSVCHPYTAVQAWAVRHGGGQIANTPYCVAYWRLSNPYPSLCSYSGLTTQATIINADAIGLHAYLCYEYPSMPGTVTCNDFDVNPWP